MKRPGIYMTKKFGVIWLVEQIEHYPKSIVLDGQDFSLLIKGSVGGYQKINRCFISKKQFKQFVRIGDL